MMTLLETLRSIMLNIQANKIRVFLTTLGVIVGSMTIIVVVGIGLGGQQQIEQQYSALSADSIRIMKSRNYTGDSLNMKNLAEMAELPGVRAAGMSLRTQSDVSHGTTSVSTIINGVTASMQEVEGMNVEYGDAFTDEDGEKRNKVAVLGSQLAADLFGDDPSAAVDQVISIGGRKYKVTGVLERKGDSGQGMGGGTDDSVIVPYAIAEQYLVGRYAFPTITVKATSTDVVSSVITQLKDYILSATGQEDSYNILDMGQTLNTAMQSAQTMTGLLITVAAVVLVVGGIGIMNVLLVSIRERTREIGILKSIGARRRGILREFLLEAVIVSFAGGFIGVLLSFAAVPIINLTGTTVLMSTEGIVLGLLFSVITGVFFGVYPAIKASKLKPIDALNYDV